MRQGQLLATGIGGACVLAIVLVAFDSVWPDWTGLKGRTLWDIAELVLVPLSLAGIAYLLSAAQRREDHSTKWPAGFDPQAAGAHDRSD